MSKLALRFISGKYKGKEHILEEGKEAVVGRSSDADIVLMEDMVSRRHTLMNVMGDGLKVADNGSTNGTFVNGEKISSTTAVKGDRILIGTSIMKLVDAQDATQAHPTLSSKTAPKMEPPGQKMPRPKGLASNQSRSTLHSSSRSMSGNITEVPLPDLIQLFSTSKKTGTLVLNHDFTVARIHLDTGRIIYASISDMPGLDPLKAMFRILSFEEGEFELLGPEPHDFPEQIEMPTEHILMEGLRHLDEMRKQKDSMPSEELVVSVPLPLKPRLCELEKEELKLLQTVLNKGELTVKKLIDLSDLSDKEVLEMIKKLLDSEYLTKEELL